MTAENVTHGLFICMYIDPRGGLCATTGKKQARASLLRLPSREDLTFDVDRTLAMIGYTNEFERKMKEGVTYRDCFKGVDLRRTEIVVGIWLVQTLWWAKP